MQWGHKGKPAEHENLFFRELENQDFLYTHHFKI